MLLIVQELGGAALAQGFLAIWATFWRLPLIYLAIFVVRGLSIAALAPLLRFSGTHLTRGGQILSTLAALRGGISLILAQTLVLGFNKVEADRVVVSQVESHLLLQPSYILAHIHVCACLPGCMLDRASATVNALLPIVGDLLFATLQTCGQNAKPLSCRGPSLQCQLIDAGRLDLKLLLPKVSSEYNTQTLGRMCLSA